MMQTCRHSSMMLLNLLHDLLDLAKHEKLTFQLDKAYFNLIDAVKQTFKTMGFLSSKKNIETKLSVDPAHLKYF